jgi:hypothetical protein
MRRRKDIGLQMVRCGLACALSTGMGWQAVAQQSRVADASGSPAKYAELPDSPGATLAKLQQTDLPQTDSAQKDPPQKATEQATNPPASTPTQSQQPQPVAPAPAPKPEGTAAAGNNPATGVAASQPAGMAIAPAKQHRTRTIVLRTGAILGAGVAIGSVVALTQGTSSKPPGAR